MAFHIFAPREPLSRYLEFLWYQHGDLLTARETILPTGAIELIVNLGQPHRVLEKRDYSRGNVHREAWIAGLHTQTMVIESVDSHMIGARFKPGGACPFFACPIHELNNQVIPMDCLWGRWIGEVRERLLAAPGIEERFWLLEAALLEQLDDDPRGLKTVEAAVQLIRLSSGPLHIGDLSEQLGISHKHLIAQFKRMVGLSPKPLARILRLNRALAAINPAAPVNWTEIAHACLFYDQAHFNRDFIDLTGFTPSGYVEQRLAVHGETLKQGEHVQFVPIG